MKKISTIAIVLLFNTLITSAQSSCPGNQISNPQFSSNMTSWSQYGQVTTAFVLNFQNGCIDTALIMQATNNSSCGVIQPVSFTRDSCYSLCYCVEFPFTGSLFNTKLTIAAITPGITVAQLLSGSFSPGQAQIIDVISATNGFVPYTNCPAVFTATGNFTDFVIVNETIGVLGTDVRVDNLCLTHHMCSPSCNNVNANFSYTVGPGYNVTFSDLSTSNPGDVLSYAWDFGDPPSGINNSSTLQNPNHLYPSPGVYVVCMYLAVVMSDGNACKDTFCIDVVVPQSPLTIAEILNKKITIFPNPANDYIMLNGIKDDEIFILIDKVGKVVMETTVPASSRIEIPSSISDGIYIAVIKNKQSAYYFKLTIIK